jgi:hypothetical protein
VLNKARERFEQLIDIGRGVQRRQREAQRSAEMLVRAGLKDCSDTSAVDLRQAGGDVVPGHGCAFGEGEPTVIFMILDLRFTIGLRCSIRKS